MVAVAWRRFSHAARWNGQGPPRNHWCRKGERPPLPAVELQRRHHRQQDHRDGEGSGDEQPGTQRRRLVDVGLGGVAVRLAPRRLGQAGTVPGRFDLGDDVVDRHSFRDRDLGLRGGVVHRCGHTFELVEPLLDAGGAGGARHPADDEIDVGVGAIGCGLGGGGRGFIGIPH
jgi:hypothetical protein